MTAAAYEKELLELALPASATHASSQYHAVAQNSSDQWALVTTAGARVDGLTLGNVASGEHQNVRLKGLAKAVLGGTVAIGDALCVDASSHLVKNVDSNYYTVGRALQAGVSGDIKAVNLTHEGYNAIGDASVDGVNPLYSFRATFDPTTNSSERSVADHGLGVYLPDNAVVVRAWYKVETTFTSTAGGTDKATLAISIPTDDVAGLVAAVAIETGTPWDAGHHDCIQDGAAANFSEQCTAIRELTVTIGTQAVTGGKLILHGQYVIND